MDDSALLDAAALKPSKPLGSSAGQSKKHGVAMREYSAAKMTNLLLFMIAIPGPVMKEPYRCVAVLKFGYTEEKLF